jgi:hypothetical protein
MSLKIEDVIEVLKSQKVPPATLIAVETELEAIEADKKAEREDSKGPKSKNQLNVILFDANGVIPKGDYTAIVVQTKDGDPVGGIMDKIYKSAFDHNASKRGRKHPIKSVADALNIKRAITKQNNIAFKVKEPVQVLITDNTIPSDK